MGESALEGRVQNRNEYQFIVYLQLLKKGKKRAHIAWNIASNRLEENAHQLGIFGEILVIEKRVCFKRLSIRKRGPKARTLLMSS